MKFGLFDHVEHAGRPLATLFDERLTFVQAAEAAGIYCLHVAEHHATPLNMVPVPGVYLGAGLPADTLTYAGEHFSYEDVPIALKPLQQPHPAFWYGSSNTTGAPWAGEQGLQFVTLGPMATAKPNIDAFGEALAKRGGPAQPKAGFPGGVAIGLQRHIFVADTEAEARSFAQPAMEVHLAHLNWLRVKHGVTGLTSRLNVPRGANFAECVADGTVIHGTPETVRAEIERQAAELGINYLLAYLFLGSMTLHQALRSLQLFAAEGMPKLAQL